MSICETITPSLDSRAKDNEPPLNPTELDIFNYIINLPSVTANKNFEIIDNLLINFAGNYSSPDFNTALSEFIVNYFRLNIDFDHQGKPDFKHIKTFDFNMKKDSKTDFSTLSKRQAKRLRYSNFQFLFQKNRSLASRQALDGVNSAGDIDPNDIRDFWSNVMNARTEASNPCSSRSLNSSAAVLIDDSTLWAPISVEELSQNLPHLSSAVGPDGLTARKLVNAPRALVCRILNSFILARRVPEFLAEAKTIFIPKAANASTPGELRPISMSSLLHRLFHRILANRISLANNYSYQFGFRDFDGTGACASLTDFLIKYARKHCKSLHMAFVDLRKAFDSVDHNYLWNACAMKGLPPSFLDYIIRFYNSTGTFLMWKGRSLAHLFPGRGVRQGDPLSSTLFNIVIESILRDLDPQIGFDLPDLRLSHLAYADDVNLVSATSFGLQLQLNRFKDLAARAGLEINISKTKVLALRAIGKERKVIPYRPSVKINDMALDYVTYESSISYMGLNFNPSGIVPDDLKCGLSHYLKSLKELPAKPQQKLYILRDVLLARFQYTFSFYSYSLRSYNDFDISIRKFVKHILHLPHDVPNSFFYASITDGGLGLFNARWKAPLLRYNKLKLFTRNLGGLSYELLNHIADLSNSIHKHLEHDPGQFLDSSKAIREFFKTSLYHSNDGRDLDLASRVAGQNTWIFRPNNFLTGRDFINFIKLRINALPSKVRLTRGVRSQEGRMCRHGCGLTETTYHTIQQCPRTHGWRVRRHDRLVQYIADKNNNEYKKCIIEPRIVTDRGLRKPDLLIIEDRAATVVDVQVTGYDRNYLNNFNRNKVNYYGEHAGFIQAVKDAHDVDEVKVLAFTISYKGLVNKTSFNQLLSDGIIKRHDLPFLASKAMVGSLSAFHFYYKSTV